MSLSDLDEVERWLRGELRPAVRGQRNPGTAIGRGLRVEPIRVMMNNETNERNEKFEGAGRSVNPPQLNAAVRMLSDPWRPRSEPDAGWLS